MQRYEHDLGLPVRRPRGKSRSAVIALTEDLDAWLRNAPLGLEGEVLIQPAPRNGEIVTAARQLVGERHDLVKQCHELRDAHQYVVAKLITNLSGLLEEMNSNSQRKRGGGAL